MHYLFAEFKANSANFKTILILRKKNASCNTHWSGVFLFIEIKIKEIDNGGMSNNRCPLIVN